MCLKCSRSPVSTRCTPRCSRDSCGPSRGPGCGPAGSGCTRCSASLPSPSVRSLPSPSALTLPSTPLPRLPLHLEAPPLSLSFLHLLAPLSLPFHPFLPYSPPLPSYLSPSAALHPFSLLASPHLAIHSSFGYFPRSSVDRYPRLRLARSSARLRPPPLLGGAGSAVSTAALSEPPAVSPSLPRLDSPLPSSVDSYFRGSQSKRAGCCQLPGGSASRQPNCRRYRPPLRPRSAAERTPLPFPDPTGLPPANLSR